MGSKKWWQSRAMVSMVVGILVLVYRFVQETFLPSLPIPPDNIVDLIVGALMGTGLLGRAMARTTIQKSLLALMLMVGTMSGVAHADVFGPQPKDKLKAGTETLSATYVDPGTILDYVTAIAGYLGTREGVFYDFEEEEFVNYLGATLYTIPDTGLSVSVGILDTDGFAASLDWNLGALVPSQDVPLMNLLKYLYVGAGVGSRNLEQEDSVEKEWQLAYGLDAQFKFTF